MPYFVLQYRRFLIRCTLSRPLGAVVLAGESIQFHSGFLNQLDGVWSQILAAASKLDPSATKRLMITGTTRGQVISESLPLLQMDEAAESPGGKSN